MFRFFRFFRAAGCAAFATFAGVTGCYRETSADRAVDTNEIRGTSITNRAAEHSAGASQPPRQARFDGDFLELGFDQLSNFKYDTYEVYDEVNGGRPLTRSDDVIPPHVKALDGRRVVIEGFIMPLRLKKGLVTEFLLFRDQAACCFGQAARMNHYARVTMEGKGFPPGSQLTHRVFGTLHVGEIYVQGYLTGIYRMTASKVEEDP